MSFSNEKNGGYKVKYGFLPMAMWCFFDCSFQKQLSIITTDNPKAVMKKTKTVYLTILEDIPEFDKMIVSL